MNLAINPAVNGHRGNTRTPGHPHAGIAAMPGIKSKAEIRSHRDCEAFLAGENRKKVASNVYVEARGTSFAIILYETAIVIYHDDGTFEADNGGWNTPTTSARATQFGPLGWYFCHSHKKLCVWRPACASLNGPDIDTPGGIICRPGLRIHAELGTITDRLDYLRGEIEGERISQGEIAELQSLADYIDSGDVVLLEWAGKPEK